jgi:hypothetical protein
MSDFVHMYFPTDKFKSWLGSLGEGTQKKVSNIVVAAILNTEREAKQSVPVDTSYLKSSIHSLIATDRMGGNVFTARKYAPYVEWGTGEGVDVPGYVMYTFGVDSMLWKGSGIRKVNRRAKAYLFNSAKQEYDRMITEIKQLGFE